MSFWKERGLPEPSMMKMSNFSKEIEEYIIKIESEKSRYQDELNDIKNDEYGDLKPLESLDEDEGKVYVTGLESRSGHKFYSESWSPLTIKIDSLKSKLDQLKEEKDDLDKKIKEVSKKANRLLSRSKHSEENVRNILNNKVKLISEYDDSEISLPHSFGENIGEINLKKSKLFFLRSRTFKQFTGKVYLNELNISEQRNHSFPLRIGDKISLCIDVDYFENYRLKLVDDLCEHDN